LNVSRKNEINDDRAEDQRAVAVENAVDEVLAEAGDGEDFFDDERAGEGVGGGGAEIAQDGKQGVAEGVCFQMTTPRARPLARAVRT